MFKIVEQARRETALAAKLVAHKNWRWDYGLTAVGRIVWPGSSGATVTDGEAGLRGWPVNHALAETGEPVTLVRRGKRPDGPCTWAVIQDPRLELNSPGTWGYLLKLLCKQGEPVITPVQDGGWQVYMLTAGTPVQHVATTLGEALALCLLAAWPVHLQR